MNKLAQTNAHQSLSENASQFSRRSFLGTSLSIGSLVLMGKAYGQTTIVAQATAADVADFSPDFF
ncbi:MAG: hypothetical protein KDA87_21505, partial [Planctomycetales bacterium]|nr:hypothetical protein [Planctomycetales bacterium]